MKLLTCNTHSIVEENYEKKLSYFVEWVYKNDYDIIALQEVNQSRDNSTMDLNDLSNFFTNDKNISIKDNNHLLRVIQLLETKGKKYYWTWTPIKLGYEKYDEGIGILSKYKPIEIKEFYLTKNKSYNNWKVRKAIGIKVNINGINKWFFSIHAGWWNDNEEDFKYQLTKLNHELNNINEEIYLMGDFNNPSQIKNEGYCEVLKSGWYDTYELAEKKDNGITVSGLIDGWKEHKNLNEMRIDFIFKKNNNKTKISKVVFNGKIGEIISDHFAVEIEE